MRRQLAPVVALIFADREACRTLVGTPRESQQRARDAFGFGVNQSTPAIPDRPPLSTCSTTRCRLGVPLLCPCLPDSISGRLFSCSLLLVRVRSATPYVCLRNSSVQRPGKVKVVFDLPPLFPAPEIAGAPCSLLRLDAHATKRPLDSAEVSPLSRDPRSVLNGGGGG